MSSSPQSEYILQRPSNPAAVPIYSLTDPFAPKPDGAVDLWIPGYGWTRYLLFQPAGGSAIPNNATHWASASNHLVVAPDETNVWVGVDPEWNHTPLARAIIFKAHRLLDEKAADRIGKRSDTRIPLLYRIRKLLAAVDTEVAGLKKEHEAELANVRRTCEQTIGPYRDSVDAAHKLLDAQVSGKSLKPAGQGGAVPDRIQALLNDHAEEVNYLRVQWERAKEQLEHEQKQPSYRQTVVDIASTLISNAPEALHLGFFVQWNDIPGYVLRLCDLAKQAAQPKTSWPDVCGTRGEVVLPSSGVKWSASAQTTNEDLLERINDVDRKVQDLHSHFVPCAAAKSAQVPSR